MPSRVECRQMLNEGKTDEKMINVDEKEPPHLNKRKDEWGGKKVNKSKNSHPELESGKTKQEFKIYWWKFTEGHRWPKLKLEIHVMINWYNRQAYYSMFIAIFLSKSFFQCLVKHDFLVHINSFSGLWTIYGPFHERKGSICISPRFAKAVI